MYRTTGKYVALLVNCIICSSAWAYDDAKTVDRIILDKENFLDIKAYQPHKSQEYQWYDSTNAIRVYSGSLDQDRLYMLSGFKFQSDLSDHVTTRIHSEQEEFLAIEPVPLPQMEIEVFPLGNELGVSLLGTAAYDKRQADLGGAVSWGRQPWNYTRLAWLKVDAMYNRKNDFDSSYYSTDPATTQLQGAYRLAGKHRIRYSLAVDSASALVTPQSQGQGQREFRQKGYRYNFLYDYQLDSGHVAGTSIHGFEKHKSLEQPAQHQSQDTLFTSIDVYWANPDLNRERQIGLQLDRISSGFLDYIDAGNSIDYSLKTVQLYGTQRLPYGPHTAWDFGVYLGWAMEDKIYATARANEDNNSFQGKFRTGFEYRSLDRKSVLSLNFSLELDNLLQSPLNGGSASFQKVF